MKQPKDTKTAAELMAELNADPQYIARKREEEEKRHRQTDRWREEQRPLLDDLRAIGVRVDSVWDLVNSSASYPLAVPVLLDHLRRSYSDRIREGMARALAVPEARSGWEPLVDIFIRERDCSAHGPKWALACALGAAADDTVFSDVAALLRDKRHGQNRVPLLDVLARSSLPEARSLLIQLRGDEGLSQDVDQILNRQG